MRDPLLERHGTRLMALKPSSILHGARTDIALRRDKVAEQADQARHYLFHRLHVVRAGDDPAALLRIAIADRERGEQSGKANTRMIYGDRPLLEAALALAGGLRMTLERIAA